MRNKIVQEARTWIDVKWRHQGRTRYGIDCAGLIIEVAKTLKISQFDTVEYQRYPTGALFLNYFVKNGCTQKLVHEAMPGDIIALKIGMFPCHCAIYTENNTIVHAFAPRRQVIEEIFTDQLKAIAVAAFVYPGIV